MNTNFPLHRFEEFGKLSATELQALQNASGAPTRRKRHSLIRPEGVTPESFFLLVDGWMSSGHIVAKGRRQIFKVHLPGDAVGTPSMCMSKTVEELTCLTDVTLMEMPLERFWRLFDEHPRIGARFLLSVQLERVALMDRLSFIGQTSAPAQLAAFILDLYDRLKPLGLVQNDSYTMMLTQTQIGDLLGMTGVHVNRTIRDLDQQGLITRAGQRLSIIDRSRLEKLARRRDRTPLADLRWLPSER